MTVITSDVQQLMHNWTSQEQDFAITGQDIDMHDPWKNWLEVVLLKYAHVQMDFINLGPDFDNVLAADNVPNPFAVFLFPNQPEVEQVISKIWESVKDIQKDCLKLMGGQLELREFQDNISNTRTIKILITTPWLFEKFVTCGNIGIQWLRLFIFYEITTVIGPDIISALTSRLLHPGTRTNIIISKTYGPVDRAVAQAFMKPDHHVIYLPYRSLDGSHAEQLHICSTWIGGREIGEKIVILCGSDQFCYELSDKTTRDGQKIMSPRVNSDNIFYGNAYREFNQGQCCAIALRMEEMNLIDTRKAEAIFILGLDSKIWIMTLYGSARGVAYIPS